LPTANSNDYQPTPVSEPVISNGTEEEPEAKIPKLEGIVFLVIFKKCIYYFVINI